MKVKQEKIDELLKDCKSKDLRIMGLNEKTKCLEQELETWKSKEKAARREAVEWEEKYSSLLTRCIALQEKLSEALPHENQ